MQRGSKCEHLQGHRHVLSSHNMGLYTNQSVMWFMYSCKYMHVCKEVLSVSTRKGTDICEFTQHGVIYKSICNMKYVYLWAYVRIRRGSKCKHLQGHKHLWVCTTSVHIQNYPWYNKCILILVTICIQRGSNCEHSQWHKQVWECTARVDIPTSYPWYDSLYVYLLVYVCIQRRSECEHLQGYKHMSACTTWACIQKYLWWNMYTCDHMYVCKEVLSASTRKGTNKCESAQNGLIYQRIRDMILGICILVSIGMCIKRGSECENSQGHKHMWACATWAYIQKYLWWNIYIYMYTCDHMYVCKEVLSASTRKGTDICEFTQHGFIYKGICDMTYVCWWVYACTQRGSKFEHSQGHRHRWVRTTRSHTRKYL